MITIRELSESTGVSKVAISKWIEKQGYKDQLQKVGNKFMIPADVEQAVRAKFALREPKPKEADRQTETQDNAVTSEIIALLRDQLEAKDREIDRLHSQIEKLQAINADTVKALRESNTLQVMQLRDGVDHADPEQEEPARTASEQRGLIVRLRRLFG